MHKTIQYSVLEARLVVSLVKKSDGYIYLEKYISQTPQI